jgi:hypothetical protein
MCPRNALGATRENAREARSLAGSELSMSARAEITTKFVKACEHLEGEQAPDSVSRGEGHRLARDHARRRVYHHAGSPNGLARSAIRNNRTTR